MECNDEFETCWICLEGVEGVDAHPAPLQANRLIKPCRCPRVVHSVCLAKWQLSQSGRSEEKYCRFCKERLPDWQANLALPGMGAVEPVMSVHFNGQTHMVKVKPGEEGRVAFIQDVRRLLRLRDNQEFSITFECKVPGHGMFLDLKGLSSYDAAVFCAAMTAVERQRLAAQKAQQRGGAFGPRGSTSTSCSSAPAAPGLPAGTAAAAPLSGSSASHNHSSSSASSSSGSSSVVNSSSSSRSSATTGGDSATSAAPHTLPPVAGAAPRPRASPAATGTFDSDVSDSPTLGSLPSRPRATSFDVVELPSAAAAAGMGTTGRRQGAGDSSAVPGGGSGESAAAGQPLLLSAPTVRSGTLPAWPSLGLPLHGFALSAADVVGSAGAAASAAGVLGAADQGGAAARSTPASARSISTSGPPLHPGAAARVPRVPGAGVRSNPGWGNTSSAYDSACEVEPSGAAAGEGAAGGGASAAGASGAAVAAGGGGGDGRHKSSVRHLRNAHAAALGGGGGGGSSLPALAEHPSRRGECAHATWLSRLLLCASFGGSEEAGR